MRYLQVPRYLLPDFLERLERLQSVESTDATLIDTTPIATEEHLYLPVREPPEPLPSTAFLLGRRSLPIAALLRHPQVDLSLRLFLSRHGRRHGALFDANNPDTQADTVHLLESFVRALEDVEGDSVCRAAFGHEDTNNQLPVGGEDGEQKREEESSTGRGSSAPLSDKQVGGNEKRG